MNSTSRVFFSLRTLEGLLSIVCMVIHVWGFSDPEEPLPHEMIFCGTYFGFMLISLFTNIGLAFGVRTSLLLEAVISFVGFTLFLVTSLVSMAHAENDIHIMYLTDREEYKHPFFQYNRVQSIASLITSLVFLMHSIFLMDMILIPPISATTVIGESAVSLSIVSETSMAHSSLNFQADEHLQLFCFLLPLWQRLKKVNIPDNIKCWLCFKK